MKIIYYIDNNVLGLSSKQCNKYQKWIEETLKLFYPTYGN